MADSTLRVHRARAEAIPWQEVLTAAASAERPAGNRLVGFYYAAETAAWFTVDAAGSPVPAPDHPQRVFELRAFDGVSEWRWVRDGETGQAAWVSESASARPSGRAWTMLDEVCVDAREDRLSRKFLLWGVYDGKGDRPGFVSLQENRLGKFGIPSPPGDRPGDKARVSIEIVEYLGVGDDHGNCRIVEERLHGLVWESAQESS